MRDFTEVVANAEALRRTNNPGSPKLAERRVNAMAGDVLRMNAEIERLRAALATARNDALEEALSKTQSDIEFTLSDPARRIRASDVQGICSSPSTCFEYGPVRCEPCAAKASEARGVACASKHSHLPEVCRLRRALADAIRRPMGVIPDSAAGLLSAADLDAAENRRARAVLEGE